MLTLNDVLTFASVLVPIVLALVQLVKTTVKLPKNYIPLIGFIIGIVIGGLAQPFTELNLVARLWAGGFAGLASTGLFEMAFNKREGYTK